MIRPARFGFNDQTAETNVFQHQQQETDLHLTAIREFDVAVSVLRAAGVYVLVVDSTDVAAPDAIFPNNWISTHREGRIVVYPMMAPNRRRECTTELLNVVAAYCGASIVDDLRSYTDHPAFLEGTGSIVFDHVSRIAYAVLSPRTSKEVLNELCKRINYRPVTFHCNDIRHQPVYHTNVVMCMGEGLAVLYVKGIPEPERQELIDIIRMSGRTLVEIDHDQMESFCGNMLLLSDQRKQLLMVVSSTAYRALREDQKAILFEKAVPVVIDIPVIERVGGGGIRCMLAELYRKEAES